jgi:hypothetical protein
MYIATTLNEILLLHCSTDSHSKKEVNRPTREEDKSEKQETNTQRNKRKGFSLDAKTPPGAIQN